MNRRTMIQLALAGPLVGPELARTKPQLPRPDLWWQARSPDGQTVTMERHTPHTAESAQLMEAAKKSFEARGWTVLSSDGALVLRKGTCCTWHRQPEADPLSPCLDWDGKTVPLV